MSFSNAVTFEGQKPDYLGGPVNVRETGYVSVFNRYSPISFWRIEAFTRKSRLCTDA